jgi:hypothetical protein
MLQNSAIQLPTIGTALIFRSKATDTIQCQIPCEIEDVSLIGDGQSESQLGHKQTLPHSQIPTSRQITTDVTEPKFGSRNGGKNTFTTLATKITNRSIRPLCLSLSHKHTHTHLHLKTYIGEPQSTPFRKGEIGAEREGANISLNSIQNNHKQLTQGAQNHIQ